MSQGSKKKSTVNEYFKKTEDDLFFVCQAKDDSEKQICGIKISAFGGKGSSAPSRVSNMKRHIQRHHPNLYKIICEKDDSSLKLSDNPNRQVLVTKYLTSENVTVSMTADKFKNCISEMVFKNSLPLTFFTSPAFIKLNGEMARKVGVSLERSSVRNLVMEDANKQKNELKNQLHGKFVFF